MNPDDGIDPTDRIRSTRVDLMERLADLERARLRLDHLIDQIDADVEITRALLARELI